MLGSDTFNTSLSHVPIERSNFIKPNWLLNLMFQQLKSVDDKPQRPMRRGVEYEKWNTCVMTCVPYHQLMWNVQKPRDGTPWNVPHQILMSSAVKLRFGSSSCSIWTSCSSFESPWPADFDYLSFGSIAWRFICSTVTRTIKIGAVALWYQFVQKDVFIAHK